MRNHGDGLTAEQIAGTAYNAYRWAMNLKDENDSALPDWGGLVDGQQAGWMSAAVAAINMIEDCVELPWSSLAASAYAEFRACFNPKNASTSWDGLSARDKVAWVAAMRHVANMLALDDDVADIEGHERYWRQWSDCQLAQQPRSGE
jgi:hypothetical protein